MGAKQYPSLPQVLVAQPARLLMTLCGLVQSRPTTSCALTGLCDSLACLYTPVVSSSISNGLRGEAKHLHATGRKSKKRGELGNVKPSLD